MSTPNSGLSIAQQMLRDGSLPDMPDSAVPMRAVVAAASTMDPDAEARTQQLASQAGMGVDVTRANPQTAQQRAVAADLDQRDLEITNPILARQLQDPNFAAVAHDDLDSLSRIGQGAASLRAATPWESFKARYVTPATRGLFEYPLTRMAIDAVGGTAGMAGNIGSFFGWHGDDATRQNLLQRVETGLSPEANLDPDSTYAKTNDLDTLAKNVAPVLATMPLTMGTGLVARTLGLSENAAKVLAAAGVGSAFTADQGGRTFTQMAAAGKSDAEARHAADVVAGLNLVPNVAMGLTDFVPQLERNPLLATMGIGGVTGATGQFAQNVVAGQPWYADMGKGALQGAAVMGGFHLGSGFLEQLGEIADAAEQSKLRKRAPEVFQQAMDAMFEGQDSLRIPAQDFVNYFTEKKLDPAAMANQVGVSNLAEAAAAGTDLEIPKANFFGQLDPEHQKGLLQDVVDPATELTARQAEAGRQELEQWVSGGGAEKLQAEFAQADAETQASPEWQQVYGDLKQRYVDAGETETAAEGYAMLQANAIANLARKAGMKPDELLALHNPKIVADTAAPADQEGGEAKYQEAMDGIRSVVEASKQTGHAPQKAVIAPAEPWLVDAAREHGIDIEGHRHVIDGSAVRHVVSRHGDEKVERSRGQLAVTESDFEKIPAVLAAPDAVVFGTKTRGKRDQIGYIKRQDDGSTLYLEEIRTGKKELAAVSMRKYPAAKDFDSIAGTLPSNARGDGGNEPIVVRNPSADKGTGTLYQSSHGAPIDGVEGWESTLLTPGGKLPAKYRLVEAADLTPSHDPVSFAKNAGYPEGVQERAYDTSKEAQARVIDQAQNYEPAYTVNSNPDAVNGPPVITPDGIVLGGNSRAMSTIRLYRDGNGDVYRDALRHSAGSFGLDPEDVDGMKEPVLVRQVQAPASVGAMRRLGSDLNRSMTGALGAAEKAVSAGKSISPETLQTVAGMLDEGNYTIRELLEKKGADVVKMLAADGVITDRERPAFVDPATGSLNEAGRTFVDKAFLGTVIDDPRVMEAAPKSILGKVERILGSVTSLSGRADEWNLAPAIRAAIAKAVTEHAKIASRDIDTDVYLGTRTLFGPERNPVVDALVRALDKKPTEVSKMFAGFARDAGENPEGQIRMMGPAEPYDAFNYAFGTTLSPEEFRDGLDRALQFESEVLGYNAPADGHLSEASSGYQGAGGEAAGGAPEEAGSEAGQPRGVDELPDHPYVSGEGASEATPRGWFRVLPDGRFEFGKTSIGDLSTFIHEPAHAYLELFRQLTQRPDASEPLKEDFKKVCQWLGTTPVDAHLDGFTREQHEQWARANEQYVREGKAPTSGLRRAFHNFAVWLGSIYRRASALGVDLSSDIRGVMDRLYAGEEAVNRAEQEAAQQLFEKPEDAGWTEKEFQNYADAKGLEVDTAKEQVQRELNDAAMRERTQAWREEKSNVREAVTEEIDRRPEYTAIRSLRRGSLDDGTPLTLNRDALVDQFGEDRVRTLNKLHRGIYRSEGGTDAETAAEIFGYGSGEEMMRALEGVPRRAVAIEQATRDYMTAKHGDIRYDGSLDDKARLAMENNERARNLHRELTALRKKVEGLEKKAADAKAAMQSIAVAPLDHYQEASRQIIDAKAPADLQPYRYLNASRKYSREAFDALRRGDVKGAADAKNKELLNHFLFREASAARDYVEKFESYAKRVQSRGIQQRLGLADQNAMQAGRVGDYRDQFNWLMARYRLGPEPKAPERTLRAWADDVYGEGKEVAIAPGILNEGRFVDYRNAPLSEVRDLHDALVNIRHLAQQEFKMYVQGKQVDFADAKQAMIASARENLRVKPETIFRENRSLIERAADVTGKGDALLMRMERLVEWLDGGKAGPWHDNLWNLASDAQGDEYKLQEQVTHQVTEALADMSPEMRRRLWTEKVNVDGISEPLTRRRLLAIAFNMGNEGNLDRLRKTFSAFGWDPDAVQKIGGMLTREEWMFVQKAWDSLKPLGVRMQELEKRLTGLPPAMVKVTPFKVALEDGTELDLAGGYFPIVMDPRFSQRAIEQDARESAQNAMQSGYVRATTSKGYTKERTGFGGPLLLDHEQVLTSHVAKVAKDLSHREFMLSSQRLLLDTDVRKTLRETLGPAYEQQFMPWLRTIINDRNGSVGQGVEALSNLMQKLRANIVVASTGLKVSTALLQITHAPRMMLYARPGSIAQSLVDFLGRPGEMTRENQELSPNEMRFRGENLDRDIRAVLQNPAYEDSYSRKVAVAARWTLQTVDHLFSHTLWRAAYRDALEKYADLDEGEAQKKAVYEADSAVRLGLGTAAPKDLPAIMRNNDFTKMITTLYGFHNGVYNQLRDIVHQFRYDGNVGKLTYAAALTAIVPAVLGSLVTGDGPQDGENIGLWAAKRALLFSADTLPLLSSVAQFLVRGRDMQFTPIESVIQKGAKAALEAKADNQDKDWLGIGLDAAESAGALLGVAGSQQAVKTLRYVKRAHEGKIENPNLWNALAGGGH